MPEHAEPPVRHPAVPSREPVQRWRLVLHRDALDADQVQKEQLAAWEAGAPRVRAAARRPRRRERTPAICRRRAARPGDPRRGRARRPVARGAPGSLDRPRGARGVAPGRIDARSTCTTSGSANRRCRVRSSPPRTAPACRVRRPTPRRSRRPRPRSWPHPSCARERQRGERTVAYDLRPFIETVAVEPGPDGAIDVVMVLRHDPEKGIGRPDEVLAELGERSGASLADASVVRDAPGPRGAPSRGAPVGDAPAAAAARSGRRRVRPRPRRDAPGSSPSPRRGCRPRRPAARSGAGEASSRRRRPSRSTSTRLPPACTASAGSSQPQVNTRRLGGSSSTTSPSITCAVAVVDPDPPARSRVDRRGPAHPPDDPLRVGPERPDDGRRGGDPDVAFDDAVRARSVADGVRRGFDHRSPSISASAATRSRSRLSSQNRPSQVRSGSSPAGRAR